jgi:putative hydrolase of the HAD superfamily
VKGLLLDLDDTLLDYSGGVDDSWREACTTCGEPAGVDAIALVGAVAEVRRWFWNDPSRQREERLNMLRAWQRIAGHALASLGVTCAGLDEAIAREYLARRRAVMRLFPEARATLEHFRRRGIPLGLVTNGDATQQRDKIERFDLAPLFDVIVVEGEFGAGKPDAAVYRHALATLGVAAADACMAGDHLEFDVAGPQRLGVRGVWVDRAGRGLPDGTPVRPDRIIQSVAELVDATIAPSLRLRADEVIE